jgi:hypothetical protein
MSFGTFPRRPYHASAREGKKARGECTRTRRGRISGYVWDRETNGWRRPTEAEKEARRAAPPPEPRVAAAAPKAAVAAPSASSGPT